MKPDDLDARVRPIPWRWMNERTLVEDVGSRRVVLTAVRGAALLTCDDRGILARLQASHPRARLIEAAPDLLAALKKAEDSLDHLWAAIGDRLLGEGPLALEYAQSVTQQVCRAREEARAAIAKAEGK